MAIIGILIWLDTFFNFSYPLIISSFVVSSPKWVLEINPANFFQGRFSKPSENVTYSIMFSTVEVSNLDVFTTRYILKSFSLSISVIISKISNPPAP